VDQDHEHIKSDTTNSYLFVDLETGGLDAQRHSILQLAAVITDLNLRVQGYFMTYVRPHPHLEVTAEALAINQLQMEELSTAPDEALVAEALSHFASLAGLKPRFAGYNCKFDLLFLDELWKRQQAVLPPYRVPWLDVLDVARIKPQFDAAVSNLRLATIAEHLGINTSGVHDAGTDLMITIEVAKQLRAMPDRDNGSFVLESARFSN
jgi:DNA polymerase III epsilon subunit-like protein